MTKAIKKKIPTEREEQIRFVTWVKKLGYRVSASANGGSRYLLEAMNFKRMGVSKGFPDIEIPLPKGGFHGFYLEMKRLKGGKLSDEQIEWINYLNEQGYYAVIANGCEEAQKMFLTYLNFETAVA